METPEVFLFGDGYYRRVVYGMGPFIGDYPEQVLVACVVQGWCARDVFCLSFAIFNVHDLTLVLPHRCTASNKNLDGAGGRRSKEHTEEMRKAMGTQQMWDQYGVVYDVTVSSLPLGSQRLM